jgi:hypothetical protein
LRHRHNHCRHVRGIVVYGESDSGIVPMSHTAEDFDAMWNAPNTLRIEDQIMAISPGPDGIRMILRHGGQTLAFGFDPADTEKLREALG